MRFGLRELVFLMVLLGLPVAAYFFVFAPTNQQIEQVRRENSAKQAKLEQLQVARHIEDLGQEINKLAEAIDVFEAKLPAAKEVDVILQEVWNLATKRGLIQRSVRTDKAIHSPAYSELPIKMKINGDFTGFYGFLLDLERLSRITRIHDMRLRKLKDTEGHVEASFTLSIFFEPQDGKPSSSTQG
jgi:type IV pilus assembly protein PilO